MSLVLAAPAATSAAVVDLAAAVPGHPGVTYMALLKQAIPNLAENGADKQVEGSLSTPLRHIAGGDNGGDPPDPIVIGVVEAASFQAGGRPRLALLADLGHSEDSVAGTSLLALFDDANVPHLLDAVDVGMDRDTGFSEQDRLRLSPTDDAIITYSEHFNTSQTYGVHSLIFVRHDHWALLEQVFTLSSRACGWLKTETPTFAVRPDPGRAYGQVDVTVRAVVTNDPTDGCDSPAPRPGTRTYRATYRWDARRGRFITPSTALQRLEKLNQADF